jgi:hypothetical protein
MMMMTAMTMMPKQPEPEPADGPQSDTADWQESTSASSSDDDQNNENTPVRYPVPTIVSEYSSLARTGSIGASNNNLMSHVYFRIRKWWQWREWDS